jgi:hypothetical protein
MTITNETRSEDRGWIKGLVDFETEPGPIRSHCVGLYGLFLPFYGPSGPGCYADDPVPEDTGPKSEEETWPAAHR